MKRNTLVMMVVALAAVIAMAVPVLVSGASVRAPKGYGGGNEPTFDPANFGSPVDNPVLPARTRHAFGPAGRQGRSDPDRALPR